MTALDSAPSGAPFRLDDRELSEVAKRAFFRIAALWKLDTEQARALLGGPKRATFFVWKKGQGGPLPRDVLERISYVVGIYKGLQVLFAEPHRADAWIHRPNQAFGGQSALQRMLAGNVVDLHAVRAYVDHARGGGE